MESNVTVCIRAKPLFESKQNQMFSILPEGHVMNTATKESFTFDKAFPEDIQTRQIFEEILKPKIISCINGINVTVCAYGQTASGKTYTIRGNDLQPGVIPLCVKEIFSQISEKKKARSFFIKLSYIELYNESINDLLNPDSKPLEIREDLKKGIYIPELKEFTVKTEEEALNLLYQGDKLRKVAETEMNEKSSRSHTIFRFYIESCANSPQTLSTERRKFAFLNIVDLAGSEAVSKNKTNEKRLKEGTKINQSLLALSNVIAALSKSNLNFINFRDSKLTRLLQSSLIGSFITIIICTISISETNYHETMNTLLFGTKAKKIKMRASVNEIPDNPQLKLAEAMIEIEKMKNEKVELQAQLERFNLQSIEEMNVKYHDLEERFNAKDQAIKALEQVNQDKEKKISEINDSLIRAMEKIETYISKIDESKRYRKELEEANIQLLKLQQDKEICTCQGRKYTSKETQISLTDIKIGDDLLVNESMNFVEDQSDRINKLSLTVEHKELEIDQYKIREMMLQEKTEAFDKLFSEFSDYREAVESMVESLKCKGLLINLQSELQSYVPISNKMVKSDREYYDNIIAQKNDRISLQSSQITELEFCNKEYSTNILLLQAENEALTKDFNGMKEQNTSIHQKLDEVLKEKVDLYSQIKANNKKNKDNQKEIKEQQSQIEKLANELNYPKPAKPINSKFENDVQILATVEFTKKIVSKDAEITSLRMENIELKNQNIMVSQELTNCMDDYMKMNNLYKEIIFKLKNNKAKRKSLAAINGTENRRMKLSMPLEEKPSNIKPAEPVVPIKIN